MWNNYGRVFAEYIFLKDFRNGSLKENIEIEGKSFRRNKEKKFTSSIYIGTF